MDCVFVVSVLKNILKEKDTNYGNNLYHIFCFFDFICFNYLIQKKENVLVYFKQYLDERERKGAVKERVIFLNG